MDKLTYDELITIVVALDNEAVRSDNASLRDLKWKVFNLAVNRLKQDEKAAA